MYEDENGRYVIESQLTVIVQRTIQHFSITYQNVGNGLNETISFKLSGKCLHLKSVLRNYCHTGDCVHALPTTPIVLKDRHPGGSAFHFVTA